MLPQMERAGPKRGRRDHRISPVIWINKFNKPNAVMLAFRIVADAAYAGGKNDLSGIAPVAALHPLRKLS